MIEQRRYARVSFREAVEFQIVGAGKALGCLAKDLSEGGLRIQISDFIPLNTEVLLNFAINTGDAIREMGRVVWTQKLPFGSDYQVGIEFEEKGVDSLEKQGIRRHVEANLI